MECSVISQCDAIPVVGRVLDSVLAFLLVAGMVWAFWAVPAFLFALVVGVRKWAKKRDFW